MTAVTQPSTELTLSFTPVGPDGAPPAAMLGVPYQLQFQATGGTAPRSFYPGPGSLLPPGLALDKNTGVLSGTPTVCLPSGFTFTVFVYDNSLPDHYSKGKTVTLVVRPPESAHPYPAGRQLHFTYTSNSDPLPVALDVSFDPSTTFEPSADFLHIVDGQGHEVAGSPFTGTRLQGRTIRVPGSRLTLDFDPDATDPPGLVCYGFRVTGIREIASGEVNNLAIKKPVMPAARVGAAYRFQFEVDGGVPPFTWFGTGLPQGLTLIQSSGLLVGLPVAQSAGVPLRVFVTDSSSPEQTHSQSTTLQIKAAFGVGLTRSIGTVTDTAFPAVLRLQGVGSVGELSEILAVLAFDPRFLTAGGATAVTPGPAAQGAPILPLLVGAGARAYLALGRFNLDDVLLTDTFRILSPVPPDAERREALAALTFARLESTSGEVAFLLPPTADAGFDQRLLLDANGKVSAPDPTLGPSASQKKRPWVTLDGRHSVDPQGRPLSSYRWRQEETGAPQVELSRPAEAVTTFAPAGPGTYGFSLAVTAAGGVAGVPSRVTVRVEEAAQQAPTALARAEDEATGHRTDSAGPPLDAAVDAYIQLDGKGSTDPDRQQAPTLRYQWSLELDPPPASGELPAFTNPTSPRPGLTLSAAGEYRISLVVTDADNLASPAAHLTLRAAQSTSGSGGWRFTSQSQETGTHASSFSKAADWQRPESVRTSTFGPVAVKALGSAVAGLAGGVEYSWHSAAGPAVEISDPTISSPVLTPTTAGVHDVEVVVRRTDASGKPTGVVTSALLRLVAEAPGVGVPTVAAAARPAGSTLAARDDGLIVSPGDRVALSAVAAAPAVGAAGPIGVHWVQVAGATVELTEPTSAVTEFVAPEPATDEAQRLVFHAYADDGRLRSEAAPVRLTVAARHSLTLRLSPGLNLLTLPVEPATEARASQSADLMALTTATFLCRMAPAATGGPRFETVLPGVGRSFSLEPDTGFVVAVRQAAPLVVRPGRAWQRPASFVLALRPGLNLVGLPRAVTQPVSSTVFLDRTQASYVARARAGLAGFEVAFPGANGPGFDLEPGRAYLVASPGGGTVSFRQ